MKNFKKAISIFVTAMFILSLVPGSASAINYGNSKPASYPWTGSTAPYAVMTNSDGSLDVITANSNKGYADADPTKAGVLESANGNYGKKSDDLVYKTYDTESRTKYDIEQGCFTFSSAKNKDTVIEFTFAYDNSGNILPPSKYATGLLMQSSPRFYTSQPCSNNPSTDIGNMFALKENGINFTTDTSKTDVTALDSNASPYNFEPGKWYTVNLVFDFENKASSTDDNLQSTYTYSTYINGVLASTHETTNVYYGFRWFRLFPAPGATMYWDNMNCYTIEDASTFRPVITSAELASANNDITIDDNQIKLNSYYSIGEVKNAVSASLKDDEVIRIYNNDYSQELSNDDSAIDTKLVVSGDENVYTYYDIKAEGYTFKDPSITIDNTKAKGNVTLYNFTGERKEFKVYLAVYNGNELVAINASNNDLISESDATIIEHTTPEVNITSGNKVRLFVWNTNGIVPELEVTEKSYTIADEYNPKNADLASVTLPMGIYNSNHNMISTLYPAFDKDVTEYTVYSYTKEYAANEITLETANSNATVSLTSAPDTSLSKSSAVYTVTSADGSVTKDYTFNFVAGNDGTKRNIITNAVNIYTKSAGTCLAQWNSQNTQFESGTNLYLQDGIYVRSATDKRTIKTSNAIIEVDIANVPEDIAYGVLRLSLTNTFAQAKKSGTVRLYKVNDAVYTDGLSAITTSNIASYIGDELAKITVNAKIGNNADMYLVNIGDDYIEELKAAGKTKMYIAITGVTNDSENGFNAIFAGKTGDSSKYSESLLDYVSAE